MGNNSVNLATEVLKGFESRDKYYTVKHDPLSFPEQDQRVVSDGLEASTINSQGDSNCVAIKEVEKITWTPYDVVYTAWAVVSCCRILKQAVSRTA